VSSARAEQQLVTVIRDLSQAAVLLEPTRLRLVRELSEPASAAGLARRLNLPRQRVNYHLRELENAGVLREVGTQRKRNCTERILQATARAYVLSPDILAELGQTPDGVRDRFSSTYLLNVATRTIRDLAVLRSWADSGGKRLATLTLETEIRFASPAAMQRFSEELAERFAQLAAKYHDESAPAGRVVRAFAGAYPAITKPAAASATDINASPDSREPSPPPSQTPPGTVPGPPACAQR
jgi:DNA-binding transcriptional ArsR family regulator